MLNGNDDLTAAQATRPDGALAAGAGNIDLLHSGMSDAKGLKYENPGIRRSRGKTDARRYRQPLITKGSACQRRCQHQGDPVSHERAPGEIWLIARLGT